MKSTKLFIIILCLVAACNSRNQDVSSDDPIAAKVDSLLTLMTLEEKVGQLNMYNGTWEFTGPAPEEGNNKRKLDNIKSGKVGAMLNVLTAAGTYEAQKLAVENSRLGIPLLFGYDVIHGYQTMFPVPIAQASSWDYENAFVASQIAAKEAAASGIHLTFSPMIDISPDARWGRIMESAGEDPYLSSVMAKAWVRGYQGDQLSDPLTIAACAKHFAAYGYAEAGRDYNTVDISMNTLYNIILPPFKAAAEAGAVSFMNAFNELNGIPATGDAYLQQELLKDKWGFDGFVVSDWGSIGEMIIHGFAQDTTDAALKAITAGSDMDMESLVYEKALQQLVEKGEVAETYLDEAVRRILTVKYALGLFEDPYRYSSQEREAELVGHKENLEKAREVARKSMVLLKNENDILPLSKNLKSVAVIGQLAASKDVPLGNWRAQAITNSAVSLVEGIQNALEPTTKVTFTQGYTLTKGERNFVQELTIVEGDRSGFKEAVRLAAQSEVVVLALGEDCFQTGEGRSQADISLKGNQEELFNELIKVNKNLVVVLMNGRPLAIPSIIQQAPAILETWFAGSESGNAIADILFGDYNPSGKLPVSFPYHVGQEPLYYYQKNTGRPATKGHDSGTVFWSHYTDMPNEAVLPFGYGLSYSSFSYKNLTIAQTGDSVRVSVEVENTSEIDGTETVQVYLRDLVASITQPVKRLVDFKQVKIPAGSSQPVSFVLDEKDFGFYHKNYDFYAEDGDFLIMVGTNSRDLLEEKVNLTF